MKSPVLVICALLLFSYSILQFAPKKEFVPLGTVRTNETLYFDETEVSNKAWYLYQNWLKLNAGLESEV